MLFAAWMWVLAVVAAREMLPAHARAVLATTGSISSTTFPSTREPKLRADARLWRWCHTQWFSNAFHAPVAACCWHGFRRMATNEAPGAFAVDSARPNEFVWADAAPAFHVSCAALLGAWLGSIAIPLDWEMWIQQWPVPNMVVAAVLVGAVAGGHAAQRRWRAAREAKGKPL